MVCELYLNNAVEKETKSRARDRHPILPRLVLASANPSPTLPCEGPWPLPSFPSVHFSSSSSINTRNNT